MKSGMNSLKLAVAIGVVAVTATAMAQGRRGGFGFGRGGGMLNDPSFLLNAESVQKELNLTNEQKEKIQQMQQDGFAFFGELQGLSQEERQKKLEDRAKENKKKIADILLKPQLDRLDEISLQNGLKGQFSLVAATLSTDDVAEKLGLSADQKKKLTDLAKESQDKLTKIFSDAQANGDFSGIQDESAKVRNDSKEKAMAVLTGDQKSKLDKLQGKEFDLTSIQFGFGGRGGRRGGQQN